MNHQHVFWANVEFKKEDRLVPKPTWNLLRRLGYLILGIGGTLILCGLIWLVFNLLK